MRQQVNLYLAEFPTKQRKKVSKKVAFVVSLVVVLAIGSTSFFYWKLQILKDQLSIEMNSVNDAKNAMDKLQQIINKSASEDNLKVKLIELKEKVAEKNAIKSKIQKQLAYGSAGFSKHFVALAKQDIEGLWITSIQFTSSSDRAIIEGETQKPDLIMVYLKKLAAEAAFKGVTFTDFQVGAAENALPDSGIVAFTISTHEIEEDSPLDHFIKAKSEETLSNEQ